MDWRDSEVGWAAVGSDKRFVNDCGSSSALLSGSVDGAAIECVP